MRGRERECVCLVLNESDLLTLSLSLSGSHTNTGRRVCVCGCVSDVFSCFFLPAFSFCSFVPFFFFAKEALSCFASIHTALTLSLSALVFVTVQARGRPRTAARHAPSRRQLGRQRGGRSACSCSTPRSQAQRPVRRVEERVLGGGAQRRAARQAAESGGHFGVGGGESGGGRVAGSRWLPGVRWLCHCGQEGERRLILFLCGCTLEKKKNDPRREWREADRAQTRPFRHLVDSSCCMTQYPDCMRWAETPVTTCWRPRGGRRCVFWLMSERVSRDATPSPPVGAAPALSTPTACRGVAHTPCWGRVDTRGDWGGLSMRR